MVLLNYLVTETTLSLLNDFASPAVSILYLEPSNIVVYVVSPVSLSLEIVTDGSILVAWAFLSMLIIITVSDIYYQLIPDKVLIFWGAILIVLYAIYPQYDLVQGLMGGFIGFITLYAIGLLGVLLFKKEALGGGDIKLYAIVGFVLGIAPMFLSIFMAALIALIFILGFMKDKTKPMAFGPFLAIASYLCLFYGQSLLDWYLGLF